MLVCEWEFEALGYMLLSVHFKSSTGKRWFIMHRVKNSRVPLISGDTKLVEHRARPTCMLYPWLQAGRSLRSLVCLISPVGTAAGKI